MAMQPDSHVADILHHMILDFKFLSIRCGEHDLSVRLRMYADTITQNTF
jgi:hypothetical protein